MNTSTTGQSLQDIVQIWKDRIICLPPKGEGYDAYLIDLNTGELINYLRADCDCLRHLATNYDKLLPKIKAQYNGYLKEAILNTIKYETTRRAFKKQHQWIHNTYQYLVEQKKNNIDRQNNDVEQLQAIIREQKQDIAQLKSECRNNLEQLQIEALLQQKQREIEQKNYQIESLKQQLLESDREIVQLKTELNKGLQELKLKYKWLLAQFIQDCTTKQQESRRNKSLQSCQNLFKKAQDKIKNLQLENDNLRQQNTTMSYQLRVLEAK
jgi:chromosome segregation ATPase